MTRKRRKLLTRAFIIVVTASVLAIWSWRHRQSPPPSCLIGGIAPHHLLVAEHDVAFLRDLATHSAPDSALIVLLPNHHELGGPQFVIPAADVGFWHDALGLPLTALNPDDDIIVAEESVDTWRTLLHLSELDDWDFYPLLVSTATSDTDRQQLALALQQAISQDILFIASVDFSHYLSQQQATYNDTYTRQLIDKGDIQGILSLNNDFVDSPVILSLAVQLARDNNYHLKFRWHGNSQDKTYHDDNYNTTSYYIIEFQK